MGKPAAQGDECVWVFRSWLYLLHNSSAERKRVNALVNACLFGDPCYHISLYQMSSIIFSNGVSAFTDHAWPRKNIRDTFPKARSRNRHFINTSQLLAKYTNGALHRWGGGGHAASRNLRDGPFLKPIVEIDISSITSQSLLPYTMISLHPVKGMRILCSYRPRWNKPPPGRRTTPRKQQWPIIKSVGCQSTKVTLAHKVQTS